MSLSLPLAYAAGCGARDVAGLLFPEVVVEGGLRCEEVRGGGMGALAMDTAAAAMAGEE